MGDMPISELLKLAGTLTTTSVMLITIYLVWAGKLILAREIQREKEACAKTETYLLSQIAKLEVVVVEQKESITRSQQLADRNHNLVEKVIIKNGV